MAIRIISINCRGLAEQKKRRAIFNYYRDRADIICIQETHSDAKNDNMWSMEWGSNILFSHGQTDSCGVAILIRRNFNVNIRKVIKDDRGRILICEFEKDDVVFVIANIYAPNKDEPEYFLELVQGLEKVSENRIIIGDFNLVMNPDVDRLGSYYNKAKSVKVLETVVSELMLEDIWRVRNEEARQYSWMKRDKRKNRILASRIDFALISRGICQKVSQVMYLPGIRTDHSAFYMVFETSNKTRGPGYWKLNTSHLKDKTYLNTMNTMLDDLLNESQHMHILTKWEWIKHEIRRVSRQFAKERASDIRLIISQLSEKIVEMEANIQGNLSEKGIKILFDTKEELNAIMDERAKSLIFKSKVNWRQFGEVNSSFFYNMEKERYNAKATWTIFNDKDQLITDSEQILQYQKAFYQKLYTAEPDINFDVENTTGVLISEDLQAATDRDLTNEEIATAVYSLKNLKTPSQDGIPIDFYKVFWNKIGSTVCDLVKFCFDEQKHLHRSALVGVINLIPKAGRDSRKIKNLRPITLLESDYKIFEKIIANRIQPVLEKIIHRNQRGFMKNRRISTNIRLIFDLLCHASENEIEAFLLSVDFSKCFDKIEYSAIFGALRFFGFGPRIVQWTKVLYTDFQAVVQNNGYRSRKFNISRSVHQGGPCSSFFFLLCAEVLALELRNNPNIKGIPVKEFTNLLGQYADDMDLYLLYNQHSLDNVLSTFEYIKANTGFDINYEKTTMYRMGSLYGSNSQLYTQKQITWTNNSIKVLGITVSYDEKQVMMNYEAAILKVEGILKRWSKRNLSLIGRINIVNTLVGSQFVYQMMVLPAMSKPMTKRLRNNITTFLWNGRKPKISTKILELPKEEGGLKLVNLQTKDVALKISWIKVLTDEKELSELAYSFLSSILGADIWKCNISSGDVEMVSTNCSNQFWKEVWIAWSLYNYESKPDNVHMQFIWYNSVLRINGTPFIYVKAYQAGLKTLNQLYPNGRLISVVDAMRKYKLSLMELNSVISCIPLDWRKELRVNACKSDNDYLYKYDKFLQFTKPVAKVYNQLISVPNKLKDKHEKWQKELCVTISFEEFISKFKNVYSVTNIPKLRSFQYRLLQRSIITNIQLKNWKIKSSELCTQCGRVPETITHMLVMCECVQDFWIQVEELIYRFNSAPINFNIQNVLWNKLVEKPSNIANFVCLMAKQYIYRQRCFTKIIHFKQFESEVYLMRNMEKYIAVSRNNLSKHHAKWGKSDGHVDSESEGFDQEYI